MSPSTRLQCRFRRLPDSADCVGQHLCGFSDVAVGSFAGRGLLRCVTGIGDPLTYRIIGCAMAVHRKLGPGFLEAPYQQALAVEFERQGIPFRREVHYPIDYDDVRLKATYRPDFVCFDQVIVELKAHPEPLRASRYQVVNYLKVSGHAVGLLLNFGTASLGYQRFINSRPAESA